MNSAAASSSASPSRALVFEPDLLLLDEPLAALDVKLREEMQLEFRRIQRELGVTTINVTHDQREALVVSDEVIVMNDGVIQQKARPVCAYRAPENAFVANFIGVTNFLHGTVSGVDGRRYRSAARDGTSRASRPEPRRASRRGTNAAAPCAPSRYA